MTLAQFELAVLLLKGIAKLTAHLDKVGNMTDEECLAAMPGVQAVIDANDQTIQWL